MLSKNKLHYFDNVWKRKNNGQPIIDRISLQCLRRVRLGRDRMVVGFTPTYAISAYYR